MLDESYIPISRNQDVRLANLFIAQSRITAVRELFKKERPILFSGEMVRAILALEKRQTRRVIKPQPKRGERIGCYTEDGTNKKEWVLADRFGDPIDAECPQCPYGQVGDHLWVRETFMFKKGADIRENDIGKPWEAFLGKPPHYAYRATEPDFPLDSHGRKWFKWRPSIFMPRHASRITLLVTGIRVERLQEISEADAKAEGVKQVAVNLSDNTDATPYKEYYRQLWDSINGKKYPWESNPWVWVIEFAVWDDKSAVIPEGAKVV